MRSTFGGLNVASSGLAAQRRAIETAGHNVANANTEGYSRQRVDLAGRNGGAVSIHSGTFYNGDGVSVLGQNRIIDQFLINQTNGESSVLGLYSETKETLGRLELTYGEPGENGLEGQLGAYWSAWDAVAMTPEDEAARTALLRRGEAIGAHFQSLSRQFDAISDDVTQRLEAVTVDINGIADQVASLNIAIAGAVTAGAPPNDLLDQRDLLVRKLADYVGITTRTDDLGQMSINIGGLSLVAGKAANHVTLDTTTPGAALLKMKKSGVPLTASRGRVQGMLDSINSLVPGEQAKIDKLALQIRDTVNAQHALGQDLDGNAGGAFFSATSARDLSLSATVKNLPRAIAAALAGEGAYSGNNAVKMAELARVSGGPDESYRSLIAEMGVNAHAAIKRESLQQELTSRIDAQREETSGVSIDEEMAMLVAYQQSFDASARFLTAIDEMIDRLINGTGAVGR